MARPWFTIVLTASLVGVFSVVWALAGAPLSGGGMIDGEALVGAGGLAPVRLWADGEWWRLITHAWLHGAWWHLALNAYALYLLCGWIEAELGVLWAAGVFGLSVLGGGLLTVATAEGALMVGASGGIFGAGGFVLGRAWAGNDPGPIPVRSLAFWLGLGLVLGFFLDGVSFAGHLGGGIVGLLLATAGFARRRGLRACGVCAICVFLLASAFASSGSESRRAARLMGMFEMDGERPRLAIPHLERAIGDGRDDAELLNALAYAYALERSDLERAEALAERALFLEPENANILDTAGWIACLRGHPIAGEAYLERALALDPELSEAAEHLKQCSNP